LEKLVACTKLDEEDRKELSAIAKKEGRTLSGLLRLIVNDWLHKRQAKLKRRGK
jgi:hypothetical protein